jgi:RNA polymerase sigma-70 factor (ECF subfamily)
MTQPTPTAHADGRFPETAWSVVAFSSAGPGRNDAFDRLVRLYWRPVYLFIRRTLGRPHEEARDLTQDFFAHLLEAPLLERYSADRGSFHAFLKTAARHFVIDSQRGDLAVKRGSGRLVSLDAPEASIRAFLPDNVSATPEELFDRAWKHTVLARAVELLEQRLRSAGCEVTFQVFQRHDLNPVGSDSSYETIGGELGMPVTSVKNHLTRARDAFRLAVIEAVSETVGSEDDLDGEMKRLFS